MGIYEDVHVSAVTGSPFIDNPVNFSKGLLIVF